MPRGVYNHKIHSLETKLKMSKSHKGLNTWMKGIKLSEEWKRNISKGSKGKKKPPRTEEHKKNIKLSRIGMKLSETAKQNISKSHIGSKNPSWKGGISFEPYSIDWTITLKRSIRERDKYICQICGKEKSSFIHHIDYDKKNCNINNLITLCHSCHSKTNHNRKYWIKYFNGGKNGMPIL